MGCLKRSRCCQLDWWQDLEARACSIFIIIIFTAALVCLVLFTDPAILSLTLDLTPAVCVTTSVRNYNGTTKCQWTSCRQSCTAVVYNCSQIYVNYTVNISDSNSTLGLEMENVSIPMNLSDLQLYISETNSSSVDVDEDLNGSFPLLVNPNGCGYEPEVSCPQFYEQYGNVGVSFQCEVSLDREPPLIIPDSPNNPVTDKNMLINQILLSLIPLGSFIITFVYVYWRKLFKPRPKIVLQPLINKKKTPEESGSFYERKLRHLKKIQEGKQTLCNDEKLSLRSFESRSSKKEGSVNRGLDRDPGPSYIKLPPTNTAASSLPVVDREQFL